ncbi:Uncharacterised protein [uncultured Clostridium sp.]|uniref:hypothetical protein n=1 Tax=uncultured Clostridium sp. TaxID=59620 RepID=UPI0008224391|nr:hypothetical protein [uncultured Clostridium sp.]SCJ89922.1 Uncharacterised protein [uncultured Clostridium sp.]
MFLTAYYGDRYKCCCSNLINSFEFQFDERADGDDVLVSIDPANPTHMLEVAFRRVYSNDIIWLSGVVVLDHEYEQDLEDREERNANITIVIKKTSSLIDTPIPIYTLEVDLAPASDDVAIHFSHVDVQTTNLSNVRYKVLVYSDEESIEDVDVEGPNTLTAIRFIR